MSNASVNFGTQFPNWVPIEAQRYLTHTHEGISLRKLALRENVAASTILRQVRRIEQAREDPLFDTALAALSRPKPVIQKESQIMSMHPRSLALPAEAELEREARRILRRLCETDAVLAASADMEQAVVLRMNGDMPVRTAVVPRNIAQAFALKDWICCIRKGRVHQYEITSAGRSALKRLLVDKAECDQATKVDPFSDQHREWGTRDLRETSGRDLKSIRVNMAESPLLALSRRKDRAGKPFLTEDLILAGERLREDFELAQMGSRVAQNWDRFLTGGNSGAFCGGRGPAEGPTAARERVSAALTDLGPGLGDVVLRCCCHLEGLEAAERRMGWSARSGKIVLRIALQRLAKHYLEQDDGNPPLVG